MDFLNFNVKSVNFDSVYLEWELSPTIENLDNYIFIIKRGEVQEQLSIINALPSNYNTFIDTTISGLQYDKFFTLYYQIIVHNLIDQFKSINSPIKGINEENLNWAAKEIIRRDEILLKNILNNKFLLLKLKTTGTYCDCWDYTVGQKVKFGPCYKCYDTNWVNGYYNPVVIYGSIGSWGEFLSVSPQGDQKDSSSNFITTYYPKLNIGDIIIDSFYHRWRIVALNFIRLNNLPIKQIAQISIVDRNDLIYKVPIKEITNNSYIYTNYKVGTLSGEINGINKTFVTADNFILNTTLLFKNSLSQKRGYDYIELNNNTIVFTEAPKTTDKLEIIYEI